MLDGKRAWLPGEDPRGNRTAPTDPSPDVQAILFPGFGEPVGSTALVQPSPWQAQADTWVPTGRAGSAAHSRGLPSHRHRSELPEEVHPFPTPPLLVFIYPPLSHPPPPLPPTIRFLKSPFVSQEAGKREREGKGTQRQRAGAAASQWLTVAGDRRAL